MNIAAIEWEDGSNRLNEFLIRSKQARDTIAVRRSYVDMASGELIAGVLLSQIVYWHEPDENGNTRLRVEKDGHLWIAKKREDWWDECRITAKQFDHYVEILEANQLVHCGLYRFAGSPTKHVRLNPAGFFAALDFVTQTPNAIYDIRPRDKQGKILAATKTKGENGISPKGKNGKNQSRQGVEYSESSKQKKPKPENGISPKGKIQLDENGRSNSTKPEDPLTEITPEITPEITSLPLPPQGEPEPENGEGKPIESNTPEPSPTSPTSLQFLSSLSTQPTDPYQDESCEASLINDEKNKQLDLISTDHQPKLDDVTSVEKKPYQVRSKRPKYVWEVEPGKPIPEFQNWWAKTHYEPQGGHWATGAYGHAYSEFYNKPEKTTNAIFPQFMAVHQVVAQNCQQQQFIGQQGVLPSYFALPPEPREENMHQLATTFRELVSNGARVALPQGIATPSCQQLVSWDSAQRTVIAPLPELHYVSREFLPQRCEESLADQVTRKRVAWKTPFLRPDIKKWVEVTDGVELGEDGPFLSSETAIYPS